MYWRSAALKKRASGDALRPVSPPPYESQGESDDEKKFSQELSDKVHSRSKSEPPTARPDEGQMKDESKAGQEQIQGPTRKPTSSSWVQWWSRSRSKDTSASTQDNASGHVLDPVSDVL